MKTPSVKISFSDKDFAKAKLLLAMVLIDHDAVVPEDEFFCGENVVDVDMSKVLEDSDTSTQMCLAMMLFMMGLQNKDTRSAWQKRIDAIRGRK